MCADSPSRSIDAAGVRDVLDTTVPSQTSDRAIQISAQFAADAKRSVWCRGRVRTLEQTHGGIRKIDPGVTNHMNPVRAIRVEDVAGHVGMGGLSHGQSAAAIAAQRIADDTGCGRAYHVDAVAVVALDDVRAGKLIVRPHDSDVHRGAPEHEDAVLPIAPNGVVHDARKAVLRDFDATVRGSLDGVVVDQCGASSVHGNSEETTSHRETLDGDFAAKNLDRGLACIEPGDGGLALSIDGDPVDFRVYDDVLSTGALDEQHVSRYELSERRPDCSSGIAINRYRCSTGWRGGGECQREENGACRSFQSHRYPRSLRV